MKGIRFRIIADSVRMFAGGVELVRDKDFTVDEETGTIIALVGREVSPDELVELRVTAEPERGPAQWKQEQNRFTNRRR